MNADQLKSAVSSTLQELNFAQSIIQLNEPVQYTIITLNGQVITNTYSDQINVSGLASGMYIIATQAEARYFVIQN